MEFVHDERASFGLVDKDNMRALGSRAFDGSHRSVFVRLVTFLIALPMSVPGASASDAATPRSPLQWTQWHLESATIDGRAAFVPASGYTKLHFHGRSYSAVVCGGGWGSFLTTGAQLRMDGWGMAYILDGVCDPHPGEQRDVGRLLTGPAVYPPSPPASGETTFKVSDGGQTLQIVSERTAAGESGSLLLRRVAPAPRPPLQDTGWLLTMLVSDDRIVDESQSPPGLLVRKNTYEVRDNSFGGGCSIGTGTLRTRGTRFALGPLARRSSCRPKGLEAELAVLRHGALLDYDADALELSSGRTTLVFARFDTIAATGETISSP